MSACQQFTVELLKILISWPVFVLIIVIYVLKMHGDIIFSFFNRVEKVASPWLEISAKTADKQIEKQVEVTLIQDELEKANIELNEAKKQLENIAKQQGSVTEKKVLEYLDLVQKRDKEIEDLRMKEWLLNQQIEDIKVRSEIAEFTNQEKSLLRYIQAMTMAFKKSNRENPLQEAIAKVVKSNTGRKMLLDRGIINEKEEVTERGEKIITVIFDSWAQTNN